MDFEPKHKDKTVVVGQKEIEKKLKYLGSFKPKKGLTVFEYNKVTGELNPASFDESFIMVTNSGKTLKKIKLIVKKNCFYVEALNKKNALRKITKS